MTAEANIEVVRRCYEQLAPSDVSAAETDEQFSDDALAEFADPEIEWVPVAQSTTAPQVLHGYEGFRSFWKALRGGWDEYLIEPLEYIPAGDRVVVVVRIAGRMRDLEIDEVWSALYAFRGGRVVRAEHFTSRHGAFEAAGLEE